MPLPLHTPRESLVSRNQIEAGARKLGLNRLTDVTGLDRLGIPVAAAIAATNKIDVISVYNGKGRDIAHANTGALLELIERRSALRRRRSLLCASWNELKRDGHNALNPERLILPPQVNDPRNVQLEWMRAVRIPNRELVLVPANAVLFPYRSARAALLFRPTTTGLAAGRNWLEAAENGLAECVERDALSLALLALAAGRDAHPGRLLDCETLPHYSRSLTAQFLRQGIQVAVRELTFATSFCLSPTGQKLSAALPSYLAISAEETACGRFQLHFGAASDVDCALAIERAITEVAQCRLTEIQGIREDLRPETERAVDGSELFTWFGGIAEPFRHQYEQPTRIDRLASICSALTKQGLKYAYAVNLTVRSVGVPVVRIIVPGLENWYEDPDRIGARGRSVLQ